MQVKHQQDKSKIMSETGWSENKRIRLYGSTGNPVIVLHGGPGASGSAAPVARGLSNDFIVFEPWQRTSGRNPLSVARHVADIYELISSRCPGVLPALVGESWGAMLALAYAAKYPDNVGPLVLIGCGTFDVRSREEVMKTRQRRILKYIEKHPEYSEDLQLTLQEQVIKWHAKTDGYDCEPEETAKQVTAEPFDSKASAETWGDMMRCQKEGIYPQAFTAIKVPVIMLHGVYDPHPGTMIRDSLKRYVPHLEYYEFEQCGHSPAIEKYAKEAFFSVMRAWLKEKCHMST